MKHAAAPNPAADEHAWRIGELAHAVDVSAFNLRSWEKRYGLFEPRRGANGYRLYSQIDHDRALAMKQRLAEGFKAQDAARAVLAALTDEPQPERATAKSETWHSGPTGERALALRDALVALDEPRARRLLETWSTNTPVDVVLADIVVQVVSDLGERWLDGRVTVAQGQFAFNLLRHTLVRFAVQESQHTPGTIWLACPPREAHDLILLLAALLLQRRGYSVRFFGANTPLDDLRKQAVAQPPDLIVLSAERSNIFEANRRQLSRLAAQVPVAIAGAGARRETADEIGVTLVCGDLSSGVEAIAALVGGTK